MQKNKFLKVSEDFFSIQGEGMSAGTPAVFLRLSCCNLKCGFCDTKNIHAKTIERSGIDIIDRWRQSGWLKKLQTGAHLVITGGEPLLQQKNIVHFLVLLTTELGRKPYIEIETNATISVTAALMQMTNQINASPKLSNSNNERKQYYHPQVIAQLSKNETVKFKFVVSQKSDIEAIMTDYVNPFNIPRRNIWLMPEGAVKSAIDTKVDFVFELCQKYCLNFSPRLQITHKFK